MAYKSQAQRRRIHRLHQEGKLSTEKLIKYEREHHGKELPERVEKKTKEKDPNKWPRWPKK